MFDPSAELTAFRDLLKREREAFTEFDRLSELSGTEESPEAKAALAAAEAISAEISDLGKLISARVLSNEPMDAMAALQAITELAEVARHWEEEHRDGSMSGLTSEYMNERLGSYLILGVMRLGNAVGAGLPLNG